MASSTGSLSRPADHSHDSHRFDVLISHLLAAKRSLSCVEHVSNANDIVTSTRHALEVQTILAARTSFVSSGCSAQTVVLEQVREYMQNVSRESGAALSDVMEKLDTADRQLRDIVSQLKDTVVEAALRPEEEGPKSLIDFVDESGQRNLLQAIKETVDTSGRSRLDLEQSMEALDAEILKVVSFLPSSERTLGTSDLDIGDANPVPSALHDMEEAAQEMANNLESLVKHFDLCVTAVKHTEGGGAAASGLIGDLPEGMSIHISQMGGSADPISDEERHEMMEVLQKDAEEVDEVVNEIKERSSDIEMLFEQVVGHGDFLNEGHKKCLEALKLLEEVGNKLSSYLAQGQVFMLRWEEEKAKIEEHLSELEGLRGFYVGFLLAYDELIIEVGRRKDTENRIHRVRQGALAEIEDILKEERMERDYFQQAQGEFLPIDIWPGLSAQPPRYDIGAAEGEQTHVPDISASIVKKAIRRAEIQHRQQSTISSQSNRDH